MPDSDCCKDGGLVLIFAIGLLTGILMGMGIGGGIILIPALIFFENVNQHTAQWITMAAFLPISAVAVITHYRQHNIELRICPFLIAGSIAGAIAGAYLAVHLPTKILRYIFAFFIFIMGIYELSGLGLTHHLSKQKKEP